MNTYLFSYEREMEMILHSYSEFVAVSQKRLENFHTCLTEREEAVPEEFSHLHAAGFHNNRALHPPAVQIFLFIVARESLSKHNLLDYKLEFSSPTFSNGLLTW